MSTFYEEVLSILREDSRFFSTDGVLLKNTLYEAAMQMDPQLIRLLYSHEVTRKRFFVRVEAGNGLEAMSVFDNVGFGWMVNNREFFPDSYTRYKNRIGLTNRTTGDFLSNTNDVELVFPYKDCILEGGQTKEEEKRQEIFYNATLAPDEVDRLLAPKVFTNTIRVCGDHTAPVDTIGEEDNLLIKGNNLLTLASIKKHYEKKVRMAYWDVPYNTGADSFGYNDRFTKSTWLVFIKNRVEQLLPMLRKDGVLLIHCSFHQYAHVKVLLDELVGNYIMTFHVLARHPERTLTSDKEFNDVVEYVLVYAKDPSFKMPKKREEKHIEDYQWMVKEETKGHSITINGTKARYFLPDEYELIKTTPSKENFKIMTIRGSIKEKVSSGRFYVKHLAPLEGKYPPKTLFKVDGIGDDMYDYRYFYLTPHGKKNGAYLQGMPLSSSVTEKPYANFIDCIQDYNTVNTQGTVEFRNGKKPEELLAFFMNIFTDEGDLVLDAFAGSGTTAAVALKLGRRFILCEQMDYVWNVTASRIRDVIEGREPELLKEYDYAGGGSFIYTELMQSNERFVDAIRTAKKGDLPGIWEEMLATGFISCKVNPAGIRPESKEFQALSVSEQKRILMDLLDLNQLYVNYCDMEDESFGVSLEDRERNRNFYK
ncbi:MAG: site-specific DNA-methyltransferase [Lachnospiraceae bacterium]|nr:site-specific DNA-methyltransferase [Lachnospiraceae bacterium]